MQWFRSEFSKSNIISGALAIGIWGVVGYLAVVQVEIPEVLSAAGMAVIAYFMGSKQGAKTGYSEAMHEIDRDQAGG